MRKDTEKTVQEKYLGERFGKLIITGLAFKGKRGRAYLQCECDCGKTAIHSLSQIRKKNAVSCGCARGERLGETAKGKNKSLYIVYNGMKTRCNNKNSSNYKYYGGKGIRLCQEWEKSYLKFYAWAKKAGYKKGLQIDRKDSNKNYEPSNCEWVSRTENVKRMWRSKREKI